MPKKQKVLVEKKNLEIVFDYVNEVEHEDYFTQIEDGNGGEHHIYPHMRQLAEKTVGWKHIFAKGTRIVYFPSKTDRDYLNPTEFSARIDKVIKPWKSYVIVDQEDNAYTVDFEHNFLIED